MQNASGFTWSRSTITDLPEIFDDGNQVVSHFILIALRVIIHYRKALKVAELKDILNKASVPYDAKTTKSGLIKKVQESPAALAVASGGASAEAAEDDLVSIWQFSHNVGTKTTPYS